MTRSVLLCLRLCEAPRDPAGHLKLAHLLEESQASHAARAVGWGADRLSLAFPESEQPAAIAFASVLLSAMGEQAIGISLRDVASEAESGRMFGEALSLAEALAEAARPGEVLIDSELAGTGTLERLGATSVRFGGTVIRAHLCVRASEPRSKPGSVALPRITPPPNEGPFSPTRTKPSSLPNLAHSLPMAPPPPEPVRPPTPLPPPPQASAPSQASDDGNDRPSHARVSLRPSSPSAPPFRYRSRGPGERLSTPPPKPSMAPLDARRAAPPKPSRAPDEDDQEPERTTIPTDPPARSETDLSLEASLVEVAAAADAASASEGLALAVVSGAVEMPAPDFGGAPLPDVEPPPVSDVVEALPSGGRDLPGGGADASLRPSVVEALRSGDPDAMLTLADQLRSEGAKGALVERLEALANLAQGDVGLGLGTLRDAAALAKSRGSNPSRSALALAVGLAMAGKREEALLQGLEALSLARSRSDRRGEHASAAFLGQLSRSAGHPAVAEAWLRASSKGNSDGSATENESDAD